MHRVPDVERFRGLRMLNRSTVLVKKISRNSAFGTSKSRSLFSSEQNTLGITDLLISDRMGGNNSGTKSEKDDIFKNPCQN